jgi:biopolymer transport protein ExbD
LDLPDHWGQLGSPAAQGARAQLILAVLLTALMPMFLAIFPIETHAVKIDLPPLPDAVVPLPRSRPQAFLLTTIVYQEPVPVERRPVHRLVATPWNEVLFDGERVDLDGLRRRLDVVVEREFEWVDFRPDPNVRYELFVELLAVTRRARLERLLLDNRAFRHAVD